MPVGRCLCTYTETDVYMCIHVKIKRNGRAEGKGISLDIEILDASKSLCFAYFHFPQQCTTFEIMKTKSFSLCSFF